ncbi:MAG TPA: RluA family pseudouridine synthase [Pirellulaceae bacterium]|nr:RluA family pseudouridine synthase [Pirellulaceae bacterium]
MSNQVNFEVDDNTPPEARRIDKVVRALTNLSVRPSQGLFDHGGVTLNGEVCKEPWKWLQPGDKVAVTFESGRRYKPAPKPRKYSGFDVVFEDQHLIVVNKHAALLTVPTERGETNTLLHRVSDYLARGQRFLPKLWIVHRLDRGVSGLLVFGKQPEIGTHLRQQLAERKPLRRYLACVKGQVVADEGKFESYLTTSKSLNRYSTADETEGEHAITHFRVLERLRFATLVEVWLETGRRNQIRVHFAEAGHPVIGDQRYRPQEARDRLWDSSRLALHAVELAFEHPVTGENCHFKLPMPQEMAKFLGAMRSMTVRLNAEQAAEG